MTGVVMLCTGCKSPGWCSNPDVVDAPCTLTIAERLTEASWAAGRWERGVFVVGDWQGARWTVVIAVLEQHAIKPTSEQERSLRWLCGWEIDTLANVLELIVSGRPAAVS